METERDKSLSEYCGYLRAEAAMVDSEEGTDCTTRACLLRGAAEEIERQREHIKMDAGLYIKSLNTIVDLEQRLAAAEARSERCSAYEDCTSQDDCTCYAHLKDRLAAAEARLRRYEPEPGKCEHGVAEGDWCEPCNKAYKDAADEAAKGGRE